MKQVSYTYGRQTILPSDIQAVISVLKSPFLTQGPLIKRFEEALCRYTGAKYAVAVSSGTAALHLACLAAGVKPGDEGITSPMTFVASANCIAYCGGTVVLADIDKNTGLIDPERIRQSITPKTKVIIPVHYTGQSCDMDRIHSMVQGKRIFIIEDACHAIGSTYKGTNVGSCRYSDMTVFSFHPVKTITTGEGGAITTNNKRLYERLLRLRNHGITKEKKQFQYSSHENEPWYYEMQELGFNYRMTDIQAALGLSQLKHLQVFVRKRAHLVTLYDQLFSNQRYITPLGHISYGQSCRHLYILKIDFKKIRKTRTNVMNILKQKGIATQVHYIPVYLHPFYTRKLTLHSNAYPHTEKFYEQCLSIPLYPSLTNMQAHWIARTIIHTLNS